MASPDNPLTGRTRFWPLIAVCGALAVSVVAMWPLLTDPLAVNDDARSVYRHVYPFAADNERPVDLFAEQMLFRQGSLLIRGLSWFAANGVPYVPFTKVFSIVLMVLCCALAFRLIRARSGSAPLAAVGVWLFALFGYTTWTPFFRCGVTPSDWLMLISVAFLVGMVERKAWLVGGVGIVAADVYPPGFVLLSIAFAFAGGWHLVFRTRTRRFLLIAGAIWFVAGIVFSAKYVVGPAVGSGSLMPYAKMIAMPEFYEGGRIPMFFPGDPYERLTNPRSGLAIGPSWWVLLALAAGATAVAGRKALRFVGTDCWAFLAGSLALFAASNVVLYRLFSPSRYVRFSIPLVLFCVAASGCGTAWRRGGRRRAMVVAMTAAAAVLIAMQVHIPYESVDEPAVVDFVASLPPDAVVAGPPNLSDSLNVLANRNMYVSEEMTWPYFPRFYEHVRERTIRYFDAYYGSSPAGMRLLCDEGAVTHWIVDTRDFEGPGRSTHVFFQPFQDRIRAQVAGVGGGTRRAASFAAYVLPVETAAARIGPYRVYDCASIPDDGFPASATPDDAPDWIWGHWVWEDESTQDSVKDLVQGYLDRDVPVGAVVIDSPWETAYNTFVFDPQLYPNPRELVDWLHERGVRVVLWITSNINADSPNFPEARDRRFLAADGSLTNWWKGDGGFVDYSNPEALAWWHEQMEGVFDLGIDGWKCDDSVAYIQPGRNLKTLDGPITPEAYRDQYYRDFYRHIRERLGPDRVILARTVDTMRTPLGSVVYAPRDVVLAGWVGDQEPTYDGLRIALRLLFRSADAGYAQFGSDVGGYFGDGPRDRELFVRWAQLGALSPIMENGGQGEHRPWMYGDDVAAIYREFVRLRESLVPYLAAESRKAVAENRSLMRVVDRRTWTYLLGADLLVSAVDVPGGRSEVVFPPGTWIDYWTGDEVDGPCERGVTVPLDRYPLYLRDSDPRNPLLPAPAVVK